MGKFINDAPSGIVNTYVFPNKVLALVKEENDGKTKLTTTNLSIRDDDLKENFNKLLGNKRSVKSILSDVDVAAKNAMAFKSTADEVNKDRDEYYKMASDRFKNNDFDGARNASFMANNVLFTYLMSQVKSWSAVISYYNVICK